MSCVLQFAVYDIGMILDCADVSPTCDRLGMLVPHVAMACEACEFVLNSDCIGSVGGCCETVACVFFTF